MNYKIIRISDDYDCETCGSSYAEGFEIWRDGELLHVMKPVAHCLGGDTYTDEDLLIWILSELGHTTTIT